MKREEGESIPEFFLRAAKEHEEKAKEQQESEEGTGDGLYDEPR